jgi:pyruvate formate lyase activating enzyme
MTDNPNTTAEQLIRACEIGRAAGLRYVYAGNLPGQVGDFENTRCPQCGALLVKRYGYRILDYRITAEGACPSCATPIAGRWGRGFRHQLTDRPLIPLAVTWS